MEYIAMLVVIGVLFSIAMLVRKLIWKEVVLDFFYKKKHENELKEAMKREYASSSAQDLVYRYLHEAVQCILKPRKSTVRDRDIAYILKIIRTDRKALPLSYELYDMQVSYAISEMAYANEDREHWSEHISRDNATLRLNKAGFVEVLDAMIVHFSGK